MYYNPNTQESLSLIEVRKLLNASIPHGTEVVGEWYFIHDAERPVITDKQRVVPDAIVLIDGFYTQTWKVEDIPAEEITAREKAETARQAEEERLPDLEDAVAELEAYIEETTNDNSEAIIDLADYVAQLEERIAQLEGGK